MPGLSILVIEDDELARENIAPLLARHSVAFARDEAEARAMLAASRPDICLIDLKLGEHDAGCSGLELIPLAKSRGAFAVVMSSNDADAYVERARELGCDDFFSKGKLRANVAAILSRFELIRERNDAKETAEELYVTADAETGGAIRQALDLAHSELPVLIQGPSGTGKTTLARLIHDRSARAGEFIVVDCSSSTPELLEGELFGARDRKGKLLLADQGTLFLDEIGAMSSKTQAKLLKAIEARTSRFRVISATREDVPSLIKSGRLRVDFFQRIHGLAVRLTPLATSICDILPLIQHFTDGGRKILFTEEAKRRLLRHDWPGNVRELKTFVERAAAGKETRLSIEAVDEILSGLSIGSDTRLATAQQYRYAREHGLKATLKRICDEMVARSLADNKGKKMRVVADLKTNTRTVYNSLARLKVSGDRE